MYPFETFEIKANLLRSHKYISSHVPTQLPIANFVCKYSILQLGQSQLSKGVKKGIFIEKKIFEDRSM